MTRVAALIRCGHLCHRCTGKHCAENLEELEIACPACEGEGCELCTAGYFTLSQCPQLFIRSLLSAVHLADVWEKKNTLPVAGGALDQSASWLDFCERLEHEENKIKHGK